MLDTQFLLLNHTSTIDTKKTIINTFLFNGQVKKRKFCSPCFISFYRAEAKDILGQDNEEMDERNLCTECIPVLYRYEGGAYVQYYKLSYLQYFHFYTVEMLTFFKGLKLKI